MTDQRPIIADLNMTDNPYVGRLAHRLVTRLGTIGDRRVEPGWDLISEVLSYAATAEQTIAEQRQRIAELEQLSFTDELTGLSNRRALSSFLERSIAQAKRYGEHGVIGFFDLDDFKGINDSYGHHVGDRALKKVASILGSQLRPSDMAARLGGDEFAVVLVRCSEADGLRRLKAIQAKLDRLVVHGGSEPIALAASLGHKVYGPCATVAEILVACDAAMYDNKAGRRRACAA